MKRALQAVFLAVFAAQALVVGQGREVKRVLSEIRAALGGEDKLAAVKTIAVEGQTTRPGQDGSPVSQDFELAFDLAQDAVKYMKKDVVMNVGGMLITGRTGFNGNDLIDQTDMLPSMDGNVRMMRMGGPGGGGSPDQQKAQREQRLLSSRREFARLLLGMLGTTSSGYPLEFAYGGTADSQNGKADVLDVKSTDGFAAKLYVDSKTHLPLMMTWMDKEPLRLTINGDAGSGGVVRTFSSNGGGQSAQEAARLQDEMAARLKEAEANRKTIEFRIFYADYKPFDGIRLPTKIQRWADGLPTDEMGLTRIKVNSKIDPAKFAVGK